MKNQLLIIGKSPFHLDAKTRLSDSVGERWKSRFYKAMICDLIGNVSKNAFLFSKITFAIDPLGEIETSFFKNLFKQYNLEADLIGQPNRNFFERLHILINQCEAINGQVHLTGTDVPDFPFHYLKGLALGKNILGPDLDGGFYHAQLVTPNNEVFKNFLFDGSFGAVSSTFLDRAVCLGLSRAVVDLGGVTFDVFDKPLLIAVGNAIKTVDSSPIS